MSHEVMNRTGIKFKGMSNFKTTLPLGNEYYRPKGIEIIILLPLQGGGQEGDGVLGKSNG